MAPILTAWFDGEAGESEINAVKEHLAACRPCAAAWQGWQHTRFLLRSTPLPLPPVGLLTRILQACRIASLRPARLPLTSRRARQIDNGTIPNSTIPASTAVETTADVSHLALGGYKWDNAWTPLPPPDLQNAILRRTTRRTDDSTSTELPVMMEVPLVSGRHHGFSSNFSLSRRAKWSSWTRHAAAIAVPAALIWVVLVPDVARAPHEIESTSSLASQSAAREFEQRIVSRAAAPRASMPNRERMARVAGRRLIAATGSKQSQPVVEPMVENGMSSNLTHLNSHAAAQPASAIGAVNSQQKAIGSKPSAQFVSFSSDAAVSSLAGQRISSPKSRLASASFQLVSLPGRRLNVGHRPKISVGYAKRAIGSPSGAVKSSSITGAMDARPILAGIVTPLHREESTTGTAALSAPRSALHAESPESREASIDMHEALAEAPSWGDSRPDDIRDAVDAYATALISDDTDDESNDVSG